MKKIKTISKPTIATDKTLINNDITFPVVDVVLSNGEFVKGMKLELARELAESEGLDLICIAPNSATPVCKISNYSKLKYQKEKQIKKNKKNLVIQKQKEIRLTSLIGQHDFNIKLKQAIGFLQDNNIVKISLKLKGRELSSPAQHMATLERFMEGLAEYGETQDTLNPAPGSRFHNVVFRPSKTGAKPQPAQIKKEGNNEN